MPRELSLAGIVAIGIEGAGFSRARAGTARGQRIAVPRVADVDRREKALNTLGSKLGSKVQ
jgi:hypothetical protein